MKLILIFGPPAVGKMTVGHELEKVTDLKLFHNHMTIELVAPLLGFGSASPVGTKLVTLFREEILKAVAESDLEGLIFTLVWAFNEKEDWDYVDKVCHIFESKGGTVYFVELEADEKTRLKRNKTSHRLEHKPTKRNLEKSEEGLKDMMEKYRMNSREGEIKKEHFLRIDNINLSAKDVAQQIKKSFHL